ncbi:MAG: uroporphyrinogen decarboxylase family protein [Planctomycetota bacterium]
MSSAVKVLPTRSSPSTSRGARAMPQAQPSGPAPADLPRSADAIRRHNDEVLAVWAAYRAGRPTRVPVIIGTNTRYFLLGEQAPFRHIDFKEYTLDPDLMFDTQVAIQEWQRTHLLQDAPMGLPAEEDGWSVNVDFQNFYEAGWFGCEVAFFDGQVPDTHPRFTAPERKREIIAQGDLDPFGGLMADVKTYYDCFRARAETFEHRGRKVRQVSPRGLGTDGPLTVAANLRGATELFTDFIEDPEYVHELLAYVTTQTIRRIKAWRKYLGQPERQPFGFADDSVQLISQKMYREFVLPCHRRLKAELSSTPEGGSIHLCGDASRHFKTIVDELKIDRFDTGFPINHGAVRRALGPAVEILGGPHVELMRNGTAAEVYAAATGVLESGICEGGRFILREGNNLAPDTPLENVAALHRAARDVGVYPA